MQKHIFPLACIMMAFLFITNDLIAGVGALARADWSREWKSGNGSYYFEIPPVESEALIDKEERLLQPESPKVRVNSYGTADLVFSAADDIAYLGKHMADPMHSPSDDVFQLNVTPEALAAFPYVYLEYSINGLENGLSVPKSINGQAVYRGTDLAKGAGWQSHVVRVELSDINKGINMVRFNLPHSFGYPVEVKGVSLRFSHAGDEGVEMNKIARPLAVADDFRVLDTLGEIASLGLQDIDMPAIPNDITNVTRNSWGYLVDGFYGEAIRVSIGVDRSKLPAGTPLAEVQIFYFDQGAKAWMVSKPDHVDMATADVSGGAPGGTNYFAGLIKSPEMPEASAFVPTAISDIKAANPAAGMNIMQPPSISNTGEAALQYPLAIPPGRQGMAPSLALTYSSDGGTGWMGMGWNIATPSVSIDSRWGVPTFPANEQQEVYLLNGKSLTMEGGIKGNRARVDGDSLLPNSRSTENKVRFFPKTMSSYKEIERTGTSTDSYFWVETTASQTKMYYGTTDGTTLDSNSILTDGDGNILRWYLKRVEDKWGNFIIYTYNNQTQATHSNKLKEGGKYVILDKIQYTGHGTNPGKYIIEFKTSENRTDARVSLKLGQKELDNHLLDSIIVLYDSTKVKSFKFNYEEGDFYKTLLKSVAEYRSNSFFYSHKFDYYSGNLEYGDSTEIDINYFGTSTFADLSERLLGVLPGVNSLVFPSPINTSSTLGWRLGGGLGIGLAPGLLPKFVKSFTLSGNYGHSETHSKDKYSLRDLNGDGLPDIAYKTGPNKRRYHPMEFDGLGRPEYRSHRKINFSEPLGESYSITDNWGFDFVIDTIYFYGENWNKTRSYQNTYITDYNADGIMDVVQTKNGTSHVMFGTLNASQDLSFGSSSSATLNPILKGVEIENQDEEDPLKDAEIVRVWRAPFDGEVSISGNAQMMATSEDNVKVGVQKNNSFIFSMTNVPSSGTLSVSATTEVVKGDLILFRAQAKDDGYGDLLQWNPKIDYSGLNKADANGIVYTRSEYQDGFLLSSPEGVLFQGGQAVQVKWPTGFGVADLTDSITLKINLTIVDSATGSSSDSTYIYEVVPTGASNILPSQFKKIGQVNYTPGFLTSQVPVPDAASTDLCYLSFEVWSTSNVDWKIIDWRPEVHLGPECGIAYEIRYPTVFYHTYNRLIKMDSPLEVSGGRSTDDLRVWPDIDGTNYTDVFTTEELNSGTTIHHQAYLVSKTSGSLLSKMLVDIASDGTISYYEVPGHHQTTLTTIKVDDPAPANSFKKSALVDSELYVGFYTENKLLANFLSTEAQFSVYLIADGEAIDISEPSMAFNIFNHEFSFLQDYHLHWGQFGWSDTIARIIDTADLKLVNPHLSALDFSDGSSPETTVLDTADNSGLNPEKQRFFTLGAIRGENQDILENFPFLVQNYPQNELPDRWSFLGTQLAAYGHSALVIPGKLGERSGSYEPGLTITPDLYSAFGIVKRSKSYSKSKSAGIGRVNSSFSVDKNKFFNETLNLYRDVNGDGYPDISNSENNGMVVNVTNPIGGYTPAKVFATDKILVKSKTMNVDLTINGEYINDDNRFISKHSASVGVGSNTSATDWVDINGDGMPDRIKDAGGGDTYVEINTGKALLTPYTSSIMEMTLSNNLSFGLSHRLKKWKNERKEFANSFSTGIGFNIAGSEAKTIYIDLNGDNLADQITLDSTGSSVILLNTGTTFQIDTIADLSKVKSLNRSGNFGISGKGAGTVAIPLSTFLAAHFKLSVNGNGSINYALNKLRNSMVDMNGDGYLDYIRARYNGNMRIYYSQIGKSNLLKTVTNPLGGSFTIDYKREGNKYGNYPLAVKIHTSVPDEPMTWDMPNSKWVMNTLVIDDGLYVEDVNSADIDGEDKLELSFYYDGGIKSRREREFLGFTRVQTRQKADQEVAVDGDPRVFISQVTDYFRPTNNDPQYRKRFEYMRGLPEFQYILRHTDSVAPGSGENGLVTHYRELMSQTKNTYEFRSVSQSPDSTYFNQVDYNAAQQEFKLVSWYGLKETETVFPALVSTETLSFPQLDEGHKDKFLARKFDIKYDSYFNVTENSDNGTGTGDSVFTGPVDTIINTYYVDTVLRYSLLDIYNEDPPFDAPDSSTAIENCYTISIAGFEDEIVCIPLYFFEPSTNPCDSAFGPPDESDTVEVILVKKVTDTIVIIETQVIPSYSAAILAQMTYFLPAVAYSQTNMLESHKVYIGPIDTTGLRRHSEVEALTTNQKAPATIAQYLNTNTKSETDLVYDSKGNVTSVTGPANHQSQRMNVAYTYDTEVEQYVTYISNSYGDKACSSYDYATGNLQKTVDINGHTTAYVYDNFYRLTEVYAPREFLDTTSAATIAFEYYKNGMDSSSTDYLERVPIAVTKHNINPGEWQQQPPSNWPGLGGNPATACDVVYDFSSRPSMTDALHTATFIDGMQRVIQIKKEASVEDNGVNVKHREVSGFTEYDYLGRNLILSQSVSEPMTVSLKKLNITPSTIDVYTNSYDYAGRNLITTTPHEQGDLDTKMEYSWDIFNSVETYYSQTTFDPVVLQRTSRSYTNARGQTIASVQNPGSSQITTTFSYDALNQLLSATDPLQQVTSYTYDRFGRMITEDHPDRGISEFKYDGASNLIEVYTPELGSDTVYMEYEYKRLTKRLYPFSDGINDVVYSYGSRNDGNNGAGRVVDIAQGSAFKFEQFKYDELGQMKLEKKTLLLPQAGYRNFTTTFEYDSWGRVREIGYPDGEDVEYHYALAGELEHITSFDPPDTTARVIVDSILYDGWGNMQRIMYGNGTETTFNYNNTTRRMDHIDLFASDQTQLLNKGITYDIVGNVSTITNNASNMTYNGVDMGGKYKHDYTYDAFNRLTMATTSDNEVSPNIFLELSMSYNAAGGITDKTQHHKSSSGAHLGGAFDYDLNYTYDTTKKHRLTSTTNVHNSPDVTLKKYVFNDEGSLDSVYIPPASIGASAMVLEKFWWNENQHLAAVENNLGIHHYVYDQSGERVLKSSLREMSAAQGGESSGTAYELDPYTVYVNGYYVAKHYDGDVDASKHYYMGAQRVASALITFPFTSQSPDANWPWPVPQGGGTPGPGAVLYNLEDALDYFGVDTSTYVLGDFNTLIVKTETFTSMEIDNICEEDPQCVCEMSPAYAAQMEIDCSLYRVMYWYHPDYLGNTEFITNLEGMPYQYFLYSAFGEAVVDQHSGRGIFDTPYRFNGKEQDAETGNYYYGARYYDPQISIWLSVDPLARDFLHLTPYNFVINNPINLIDPDGMAPGDPNKEKSGSFNITGHAAITTLSFGSEVKLFGTRTGFMTYSGTQDLLGLNYGSDNGFSFSSTLTNTNSTPIFGFSGGGEYVGGEFIKTSNNGIVTTSRAFGYGLFYTRYETQTEGDLTNTTQYLGVSFGRSHGTGIIGYDLNLTIEYELDFIGNIFVPAIPAEGEPVQDNMYIPIGPSLDDFPLTPLNDSCTETDGACQ